MFVSVKRRKLTGSCFCYQVPSIHSPPPPHVSSFFLCGCSQHTHNTRNTKQHKQTHTGSSRSKSTCPRLDSEPIPAFLPHVDTRETEERRILHNWLPALAWLT